MVQVSEAQWNRLNAKERALAKSLGVTPKAVPKGKKPLVPPKPYLIRAVTHCYLCEGETVQFFHMETMLNEQLMPYLQSRKVTVKEAERLKKLPLERRDIEMSTCPICPKVLNGWAREDLIKKLIQVYPVARTILVSGGKP